MMNFDGPTESAYAAQGPQNSSPYSALDSELESYMVHAAAILATKSKHPERQARLAVEELKEVVILTEYVDFANVFSSKKAHKLPPHFANGHNIPTEKGKQPPFGPTYNLS